MKKKSKMNVWSTGDTKPTKKIIWPQLAYTLSRKTLEWSNQEKWGLQICLLTGLSSRTKGKWSCQDIMKVND